jgi:hypothetical protein
MVPILLVLLGAVVAGLCASAIMTWASSRSPLCNMVLGGVLAVGVLAGAIVIACSLARAAYP